jgi:hypothetical protein
MSLKICKKSKNARNELVSSSIDAELNGEHFIPAYQHSMSGDFSSYSSLKLTVICFRDRRHGAHKSPPELRGRVRGGPGRLPLLASERQLPPSD